MKSQTTPRHCKTCLNHDLLSHVVIDESGLCNQCQEYTPFIAKPSNALLDLFTNIKKKNHRYEVLVPLSGGKDSTYVLCLALKKYKLKVLAYTLDNGFMSDIAKENIEKTIAKAGVDHVWYRHDKEVLRKMYRTSMIESGELCGVCGIAIERSMLKISEDYKIPIILLGHSPVEHTSFTKENIYDQKRLRTILNQNPEISEQEINEFLIYPRMNFITAFAQTKLGKFGKKINILYYEDLPSDAEIGEVIKKELNWRDSEESEYTRHFDCIAEPFSNFIRDKRFGSSRRLPQINNMIRNQEITKVEAEKIIAEDKKTEEPANYKWVMDYLNLGDKDLESINNIPIGVYSQNISRANKVFAFVREKVMT